MVRSASHCGLEVFIDARQPSGQEKRRDAISSLKGPRVVTLLPAATEIVCALGAQEWLVGRSHECDFPTRVQDLPSCTSSRLNVHRSNAEIDRDVRRILAQGLSLYEVNPELLRQLAPDVVVTQTQCEVCAVSLGDVQQALASWIGSRPELVSLEPATLADVWETFRSVGDALGLHRPGEQLAAHAHQRVNTITQTTHNAINSGMTPPRLACIEWLEPLMTAGNWMPELIDAAGGTDVFSVPAGAHSPWIDIETLAKAAPDTILAMPCGLPLAQVVQEADRFVEQLRDTPAFRHHRIALADGNQYFNRSGPRLIDSLELLCEVLGTNGAHDGFSPKRKFENVGWCWARI